MSGSAQFTDAKTFVRQKWQDQKVLDDIYKLADDKAENKAVKDLAEKAAKDHKQAQDKLKDLASELKVDKDTAAAPAGQPSSQITSIKNRLNTLSGKEFDKTFLSEIINVHQVDIALFQAASTRATEESVKKFAQECVPKLQQHLQSAKDAYQQVTGTAWTPGLGSYTPTATYSTQPGATGTGTSPMGTSPGTSTSPSGASSSSAPGSTSGASHSGTAQPDTDQ
jgi:putative membrane protein